jgi:hypothetical protein
MAFPLINHSKGKKPATPSNMSRVLGKRSFNGSLLSQSNAIGTKPAMSLAKHSSSLSTPLPSPHKRNTVKPWTVNLTSPSNRQALDIVFEHAAPKSGHLVDYTLSSGGRGMDYAMPVNKAQEQAHPARKPVHKKRRVLEAFNPLSVVHPPPRLSESPSRSISPVSFYTNSDGGENWGSEVSSTRLYLGNLPRTGKT